LIKIPTKIGNDSSKNWDSFTSTKVLNATNIERQNVKLCVRFFDEKNITTFQLKYPEISEGTVKIFNIILSWWKIVNCKSLFDSIKSMDSPNNSISEEFFGMIS
jgi:hypothetical protein